MARKKPAAAKFGEHIGKLFELFSKADKKKLEAALKSQDIARTCAALGVTEEGLKELLGKGIELTQGLLENSLKEAVAAFKKSSKA